MEAVRLVNNAARFARRDVMEITEADWDFILDVNLKAVFFCAQEAARRMRNAGEGRIVNLASLGGIRPWAQRVHYSVSKAGVIMLTQALAKALAPEIAVNPWRRVDSISGCRHRRHADDPRHARAAWGTPEEIADAVVYLLKSSNFLTGQVLTLDGGLSLR